MLVDNIGNRTLAECRRVLTRRGALVGVGGAPARTARMMLLSPLVRQRLVFFIARQNRDDLAAIRDLLEAGKVAPVIDRTYPLSDVSEAIGYLEQGHARGKVVISV